MDSTIVMRNIQAFVLRRKFDLAWLGAIGVATVAVLAVVFVMTGSEPNNAVMTENEPGDAVPLVECGAGTSAPIALDGETTLLVEDSVVHLGQTTSVSLTLSNAVNGVSGFLFETSVSPSGVVSIKDVDIPDIGLTRLVSNSGSFARFAAVDLNRTHEAGAVDIQLAIIQLDGIAAGTAKIDIIVKQFDDDAGNMIEPRVRESTITVCP